MPSIDDRASPDSGTTRHRGSSIGAASEEEIKKVEEANKIVEEPEKEQYDEKSAPTINDSGGDIEPAEQQHVHFGGERQGEEMDRVKEELSRELSPARVVGSRSESATPAKSIKADVDVLSESDDTSDAVQETKTHEQAMANTAISKPSHGTEIQSQLATEPAAEPTTQDTKIQAQPTTEAAKFEAPPDSTKTQEQPTAKFEVDPEPKIQEQPAAEPTKATESVED